MRSAATASSPRPRAGRRSGWPRRRSTAGAGDPLLRDRLEIRPGAEHDRGPPGPRARPAGAGQPAPGPGPGEPQAGAAAARRRRRHGRLRQGRHHRARRPAGRGRDRDAAHAGRGRPDPRHPAAGAVRRVLARAGDPGPVAAAGPPAAPAVRGPARRRDRRGRRASAGSPPSRWTGRTWPGCGSGWRRCRRDRPGTAWPARSTRSGRPAPSCGSAPGTATGRRGTRAVVADTVLAWDWERFAGGVPVGFDALHYDLQPRALGRVDAAGAAAADSVRRAPGLLAPLGVPAGVGAGRRRPLPGRDPDPVRRRRADPVGRLAQHDRGGCWPPPARPPRSTAR